MATTLEKLQKEIDRCNNRLGCSVYCSQSRQATCPLLNRHRGRIDFCIANDIPIEKW